MMKYDFAILGAGIAGLTLLDTAFRRGLWLDKKILLVDRSFDKNPNKRISFWSTEENPLPHFEHLAWNKLAIFSNQGQQIDLVTDEYRYFSFDASAYRANLLAKMANQSNVTMLEGEVENLEHKSGICEISVNSSSFHSEYVFQTIFEKPLLKAYNQYFLQHFVGWKISTKQGSWDANKAIIMDYRTPQENGTTFIYCLPVSEEEIFVEYTIFSKNLLSKEAYRKKLTNYLSDVWNLDDYKIIEEEYGVIPMTDFAFDRRVGNIISLGSAGGDTRGSTGYTFTNTVRTIDLLLSAYEKGNLKDLSFPSRRKEQFYDAILLHVLDSGNYEGHALFTDLFRKAKTSRIFRFLDSESGFVNDLHIMLSLRTSPFLKGMFRVLKKKWCSS